jgi:putative metallohydrolase (TIGR04338 family)
MDFTFRRARVVKPARERDAQRARVYRADGRLVEIAKPLPEMTDLRRYVRRVWALKRVQAAFPQATALPLPTVSDGRGRRSAGGNLRGIKMPLWARNEAVTLHELAHTITLRTHGPLVAAHGWQYCAIYLRLTLYAMGREAHDVLERAFLANRVRYTKPRQSKET